ncbi:type VI secretion system-associated protein TagO [Jannaschia sp. KMU-145]|uniref:type VI secretion system-associated protein TagO n=1 Tax=Jannaschia halovivens TaxID=3388667 RepID=UPI00396AF081
MSFILRSMALVLALASGYALGRAGDAVMLGAAAAPAMAAPQQAAPTAIATEVLAVPPSRPATPTPPPSPWTVLTEDSTFDGFENVYLSTPSDAPLTCGARRRATLFLRCFGDRTAAYIAHDCQTPARDPDGWPVELRLDDGPATATRMQVDDRGESLGYWTYEGARTFIEDLAGRRTLHARFTDQSGRIEQLSFPISGLAPHLDALRAACHWSETPPWSVSQVRGSGAPTASPLAWPEHPAHARPDRVIRAASASARPPLAWPVAIPRGTRGISPGGRSHSP